MKTKSLEEIARKLAMLKGGDRRRALLAQLGPDDNDESPEWLDQALIESQHLTASSRFAEGVGMALTGPVPRPTEKMRAVRLHSEEAEAATLLGMVDSTVDGSGREAGLFRESHPSDALVSGSQAALFLPVLLQAWEQTARGLELKGDAEFQLTPTPEIEVSAFLPPTVSGGASFRFLTSAGALSLPAGQLAFLMGRSLAKLLYGHGWMLSLSVPQSEPTGTGQLPPDAEAAWLRWCGKAEFSADRAGLLAAGDWGTSARALLQAELGIGGGVTTADDRVLFDSVSQLRGAVPTPVLSDEGGCPPLHPLSLRLVALKCFADRLATAPSIREGSDHAEADVDALLRENRRHPRSPREIALMEALASGGILLLVADGQIDNREGRLLVRLLFEYFTESPEEVLSEALEDPQARLADALKELRTSGGAHDGEWLISRLVEVAKVDEVMLNREFSVIASIAAELGVRQETLVRLLVEGASAGGREFRSSSVLNRTF